MAWRYSGHVLYVFWILEMHDWTTSSTFVEAGDYIVRGGESI